MAITTSTIYNQYIPDFGIDETLGEGQLLSYDQDKRVFKNINLADLGSIGYNDLPSEWYSFESYTEIIDWSLNKLGEGLPVKSIILPWKVVPQEKLSPDDPDVPNKNSILMSVSGVHQGPDVFDLQYIEGDVLIQEEAGKIFTLLTLTDDDEFPDGEIVDVSGFQFSRAGAINYQKIEIFDVGNTTTNYLLNWSVSNQSAVFVFIDGSKITRGIDYDIQTGEHPSYSEIVFTEPPAPTPPTPPALLKPVLIEIYGFEVDDVVLLRDSLTEITGINLGDGEEIFARIRDNGSGSRQRMEFKTLTSDNTIALEPSLDGQTLNISATLLNNSDSNIIDPDTNEIRDLVGGDNIEIVIDEDTGDLVINYTPPVYDDVNDVPITQINDDLLHDVGDAAEAYHSIIHKPEVQIQSIEGQGSIVFLKKLRAGTGLAIHDHGDHLVLSNKLGNYYVKVGSGSSETAYITKLYDEIVGVSPDNFPALIDKKYIIRLRDVNTVVQGEVIVIKSEIAFTTDYDGIKIEGDAGQTIDGQPEYIITEPFGSAKFYSDGTNWFKI